MSRAGVLWRAALGLVLVLLAVVALFTVPVLAVPAAVACVLWVLWRRGSGRGGGV